jgi:uncharacterized protein
MNNEKEFSLDLLILQPTPFCNIHCDYCYLPNRQLKRTLSLDLIDRIFCDLFASTLLTNSQVTVVWHAGEPLILPVSYYRRAFNRINELNTTNCHIHHAIQTNGMLINQEWCDFIKEYSINIGLSIDGPAFIHDRHRKTRAGKGTHAKALRGATFLRENGIDFHVIAVLTRESLYFPDELFNFFIDNEIKRIGFNIEEIEGINTSSSLQKDKHYNQYCLFMNRIHELTKKSENALSIREFDNIVSFLFSEFTSICSQQVTPFNIIAIDYEGNFTTFSPELLGMKSKIYGDFIIGNIHKDTFLSPLKTTKFQEIYEDIKEGVRICKQSCSYFNLCGGGAASNKYFENGTFRSAETMYCKYMIQVPTDIVLHALECTLSGSRETHVIR